MIPRKKQVSAAERNGQGLKCSSNLLSADKKIGLCPVTLVHTLHFHIHKLIIITGKGGIPLGKKRRLRINADQVIIKADEVIILDADDRKHHSKRRRDDDVLGIDDRRKHRRDDDVLGIDDRRKHRRDDDVLGIDDRRKRRRDDDVLGIEDRRKRRPRFPW